MSTMKKQLLIMCAAVTMLMMGACRQQSAQQGVQDSLMSAMPGTAQRQGGDAEGRDYASTGNASLLQVVLPRGTDNVKVQYKAMTVYFNPTLHIPNAVAYEITATQMSMADAPDAEQRSNYQFNRDPQVKGCPDWWEYKECPYDRGHMAPAMDMRWDKQAMKDCFYLTNICPQDHELNNGEWRKMEEAIHVKWARKYGRLVIVTGPVLTPHMEKTGKNHDIAVPERFYKVVLAPDQNYGVAFVFDNEPATTSWRKHAVSIDEVERITGCNFFAAVEDGKENAAELQNAIDRWPDYDRDAGRNHNRRNYRR